MSGPMAVGTHGNEVVQLVVSECAARADVMDFEPSCTSALLISSAISLENLRQKESFSSVRKCVAEVHEAASTEPHFDVGKHRVADNTSAKMTIRLTECYKTPPCETF